MPRSMSRHEEPEATGETGENDSHIVCLVCVCVRVCADVLVMVVSVHSLLRLGLRATALRPGTGAE